MEALNALKNLLVQVAGYQLRREELNAQRVLSGNGMDGATKTSNDQKIADCDSKIQKLKQNYTELSHRAGAAFDKMYDLPFLRRARAVRWQLTISTSSYTILSEYLRNENLKSMSTLLQTKCELHVEKRDPVPFIPACLVDGTRYPVDWENVKINWATPLPRSSFETDLPFPKFNLEQEYENQEEADIDKITVEFNRALLMNGFRKLEALERKREYEVLSEQMQKKLKEGDSSLARKLDDPLKPSILLTSLCSNSSGPFFRTKASPSSSFRTNFTDVSAIWEEAGIGMVCAKLCEPDGRRLAVGCDDSAVRIWDATKENNDEPLQVLLGHKNGFPVFDVSWNRDGRALLSCGGDGAVRLWDTMAIGPFGEVAPVKARRRPSSGSNKKGNSGPPEESDVLVPDLKHEKAKYMSGAALAVYRGHAPSSPVWSVSFSPSGYYFASAAADATARLWTTDRPVPVRLFTGHTASNVNCVEWHPNCNYIITGSDDKSARLWDIQTGRTLRLLIGCQGGVNAVKIDPSGRLAAVADVSGTVHLWDLGTGKRVTEFRTKKLENRPTSVAGAPLVHALKFSACGSALATGGDDCCIRVWDVRANSLQGKPQTGLPVKTFSTRQTMIMDLYYTKRNLLLAAGKYVTLVPLAPR
jgi:WD40 repeat protein